MDKCKYLQIINSIFFKNYDLKKNKKQNTLILSIVYSFNLISKDNFNIWNLCYLILKKNNVDDKTYTKFFHLITVFYCFFSSYQNTYSLPCLLNKKMINDQISSHIVFGEHLTQLTNFILISEAMNIIHNNIEEDKEILELIDFCYTKLTWLSDDNILIKNFNNLSKEVIELDFNRMHYQLFKFAITMTYKIIGKNIEDESELSIKKLYKISFPSYKVNDTT